MNNMTIDQAATVLGQLAQQATGETAIAAISTPQTFVAVAQSALKHGYDPILNAISQAWSKTIFAVRPWNAPGSSLEMDTTRWGNAVRKLSPVAQEMVDDMAYLHPVAYDSTKPNPTGNGMSVDMWKISKQDVQQLNFYGSAVYQQRYTTFKNQLDVAFSSAEEFARFNSMNLTERANDLERYRAAVARGIQANLIGALIDEGNSDRVVHLLTEYNAESGLSLTAQSVYQPANYAPFMRWVWARVKTIMRNMSEHSAAYQTVVNGKSVLRHTDAEDMRVAIYAKVYDQMESMVLSDTYHDDYLKGVSFEAVNFWQSIETPDRIAIKPVYTDTTGAVKMANNTVEQAGIFGLIHDRDAIGYNFTDVETATTPLNIDGLYWNTAVHSRVRTLQDMTEKAVVLLLD